MKRQLLFLFIGIISITNYAQTFQEDLAVPGRHFTELNTIELQDGTNDYIVAGSLWDESLGTSILSLTRINDANGSILWNKTYDNANLIHFRAFDIVRFPGVNKQEKIALTGSVYDPSNGFSETIIALFDATTGSFNDAMSYDISNNNLINSQGLHIIYTEKEHNGEPTSGFVVGGFAAGDLASNVANNQIGFVLRVDLNLNQLWLDLVESGAAPNYDFDVVNHVLETADGYFLTGGKTVPTSSSNAQQAVLALKVDGNGVRLWEQSYIYGNSYDNGVDTYYDRATDEIYLLTNYSITHSFGITVYDNSTGRINYSKSWVSIGPFANINGFKLSETEDVNTLVINGYVRDYNMNIENANGVLISTSVQATPFVYSFDKNTGNQVSSYIYHVPFNYPSGFNDFFKFFNWQFPVAYYPDMALYSSETYKHFSIGYRNRNSNFSNIEMIKTTLNLRNDCENETLNFTHNPISVAIDQDNVIPYSSNEQHSFELTTNMQDYIMDSCDPNFTASIDDDIMDSLTIYPNPVKDMLYISLPNNEIEQYELYDILGKIVSKQKAEDLNTISVSSLKSGIYFIKIIAKNGKIMTSKFVKK